MSLAGTVRKPEQVYGPFSEEGHASTAPTPETGSRATPGGGTIPEMPSRLAYAILFASDLERSIRFYRDAIGLPFRFSNESYAEFTTEGSKFALFARSHLPELIGREAPPDAVPWPQGEVAFQVDDPDAEYERLRGEGVTVLAPPTDRPWGERTLHVADPDGNVVELTRPKRS
jgi:lactoylglutathione lyase